MNKATRAILALTLISSGMFSQAQSMLNIAEGARLNLDGSTSLESLHLMISEDSQVLNRGELTVWGVIGNAAGPSGLVMKADEAGYGSLLHYSPGVNATVEQYVESERWHLVSSPVTNAQINTYLNLYLKLWKEPTAEWEYLSKPVTLTMNITQGYSTWASDLLTGTTTVSFEGTLVSTNMPVNGIMYTPESANTGFFLAGNPYPCALEWNTDWSMNNVGGWAVVYDNGTYKGWNPYMPEGEKSYNGKTDGFIAPTQGFWVRATGADPWLMIPQSARAHKPDMFLKDTPGSSVMNLHLTAKANGYTDEMSVLFLEDGTTGFDGLFELEKHFNVSEAPTLYSIQDFGKPMAVQVLPADWFNVVEDPVIPLGFSFEPSQECEIAFSGLDSFMPEQQIFLEDLHAEVIHDIFSGPYLFSSNSGITTDRFLLHFISDTEEPTASNEEIRIYSHGQYAYINVPADAKGHAEVFDMLGRKICTVDLEGRITSKWLPEQGYYIITVICDEAAASEKVYISNL